ncbi:MAG: HAD family hydrolase [Hydrogenobacter thermophilus]|uniref:HAD family hydrolase n=1 Tax=Hydrogenobacter thermophilus TaxID=940 RepID=UPI001C776E49|nr:HAD-IA family hydrolase [Hydrogenobacter thermophilus]QWK20486.1 MAG: HAD family hydrolase [Hydrogenobacter thermophilus]
MKGLLFDVDGVIVDVKNSYHYAIKHTAEEFLGIEIPIEEVRRIKFSKGINNDWLATLEVIKEYGGKAELHQVIEKFNQAYRLLRDKEELILDHEFFKRIKALGYPLGIITGRPREDIEYTFERFGLFEYFDFILDDEFISTSELKKPHPFALHLCIESMNLSGCVYVGDSKADWEMVMYYKKMYEKPAEYIHFGKNVNIDGVKTAHTPKELILALQEALMHL